MISPTISDQQKKLQEALRIEKKLAFFTSVDDNDQYKIIQERKELAKKLKQSASGEFNKWSVCAQMMLHDQDLQNLGIMAGGMIPERRFCHTLTNPENLNAFLINYWQHRLDLYQDIITTACKEDEKPYLSHDRRRQGFSVAIHGLEKAIDQINASEDLKHHEIVNQARYELARAYFSRGRIVRPKGFSVPGKKKELFQRALDQLSLCPQKDENLLFDNSKAQILKAQIYLEWLRFFPQELPADLDQTLSNAYQKAEGELKHSLLVAMAERAAGKNSTTTLDPGIKNDLTELKNADGNLKDGNPSLILRARAATVLEEWGTVEKLIPEIIESLGDKAFFDEDWERVVQLLKDTHHKYDGWAKFCGSLWNLTTKKEQKDTGGCHLRWYWSRQRDVYDLAFEAAGKDLPLKARIADSLKSRPALHFSQLEKMGDDGDETIKQWLKQQEAGFLNHYIPNLSTSLPSELLERKEGSWPELPENWMAVHFYLTQWPEKKGHALIHNSIQILEDKWAHKTFDYQAIWSAYIAWQNGYHRFGQGAAPILQQLCEIMGKELHWLFDDAIVPASYPMVFVPHDFLHRLPIHMTTQKNIDQTRILITDRPVSYLTAWWHKKTPAVSNGNIVALIDLGKDQSAPRHEQAMEDLVKTPGNDVFRPAVEKDLLTLKTPPKILILQCHGKGHIDNPFASSLRLGPTGVSYQTLLTGPDFTGSRICLCACETELTPTQSQPLDEHQSISSAFLQKNASEVLGALWKVAGIDMISIVEDWLEQPGDPLNMIKKAWIDNIIDPSDEVSPKQYYRYGAFRVLGVFDKT
jgi:hypothetical protein